jgi:DNA-directed RNA polymerase specialized sigma24 family protein
MKKESDFQAVIDAVQDQTRVMIALSGKFESRAEAVRILSEMGIAPTRLAALLGVPPKQIHSALAKAKARSATRKR